MFYSPKLSNLEFHPVVHTYPHNWRQVSQNILTNVTMKMMIHDKVSYCCIELYLSHLHYYPPLPWTSRDRGGQFYNHFLPLLLLPWLGGVKILSGINRYSITYIPGLFEGWELRGIPGKKQGDKTFM